MSNNEFTMARRQMLVGRAKKLHDEGYTANEIAAALGLSESTVRSIKKTIDDAATKNS